MIRTQKTDVHGILETLFHKTHDVNDVSSNAKNIDSLAQYSVYNPGKQIYAVLIYYQHVKWYNPHMWYISNPRLHNNIL